MATRMVLYTDGSRNTATSHGGCAFVYFVRDEGAWRGKSRALGRIPNPQAAEESAIWDALVWCILSGSRHITDVAVRCDALWLVNDIRGCRDGSAASSTGAVREIVATIKKLEATKTRVSVEWVAAHRGVEGNAVADYAANEARIRSPYCFNGRGSTLTMPVKLWSPGPEEEARYTRPGEIEYSHEHDRLLAYAASDEGQSFLQTHACRSADRSLLSASIHLNRSGTQTRRSVYTLPSRGRNPRKQVDRTCDEGAAVEHTT